MNEKSQKINKENTGKVINIDQFGEKKEPMIFDLITPNEFQTKEGETKTKFVKIGKALLNSKKTISIFFDALPLGKKALLMPSQEKKREVKE